MSGVQNWHPEHYEYETKEGFAQRVKLYREQMKRYRKSEDLYRKSVYGPNRFRNRYRDPNRWSPENEG